MMVDMKLYQQCRLNRGVIETTRWIEVRGARVGARVQVLPDRRMWEVVEVFADVTLREDQLREMQSLNRKSLPSVEAMG